VPDDGDHDQRVGPAVGNMEGRSQDVGQAVVDPEKGVGEGHAGDGGGIVHLLAGEEVAAVPKRLGQIFEDKLDRLERKRIGIIGCKN
jgi:hypothetical protein